MASFKLLGKIFCHIIYISIGDIDDTDQGLPLGASELLVVALGDHTPPRVILVGGQIRDLDTTSVIFVLQNKNENLKNRKKMYA